MIKPAPNISWPSVEGELALFDNRDGSYHVLNGSAARIWLAIAEHADLAEATTRIATAYGVPADTVRADVDVFIEQARQKGLLIDE